MADDKTSMDDALLPTDGEKGSEEEEAQPAEATDRSLLLTFALMVVVGLFNNVFRVLQFGPMHSYALTVNLLTTFMYIPVSFAFVWVRWDKLTDEEKAVPWRTWAVMGCLDATAGIMQSLGVAFVLNGTLTVLLLQFAIPASMVITRLLTPKRYRPFNYIGAVLVVGGICVVLLPHVLGGTQSSGAEAPSPGQLLLWSLVIVASCIPMALSSVYKELALGDTDCDVWHMNGQVAFYQLIASLVFLVPSGLAESIAPDKLMPNVWDGLRCLVAVDTLPTDNCTSAPYLVGLYCLANLGYNVLIIVLLKLGGSNLLWLCLTLVVPLASMTFTLPFIPAANRGTVDVWTILGLLVIMVGLAIYRFFNRIEPCLRAVMPKSAVDWLGEGATAVRERVSSAELSEAVGAAAAARGGGDDAEDDDGLLIQTGTPSFVATPGRGGDALHVPRRKRKQGQA